MTGTTGCTRYRVGEVMKVTLLKNRKNMAGTTGCRGGNEGNMTEKPSQYLESQRD